MSPVAALGSAGVPSDERAVLAFERMGLEEGKHQAVRVSLATLIKSLEDSGVDSRQHGDLLRTYGDLVDGHLFPEEQCTEALVFAKQALEDLNTPERPSVISKTLRALEATITAFKSPGVVRGPSASNAADALATQSSMPADQIGEEIETLKQRIQMLEREKDKQETLVGLLPFLAPRKDEFKLYNSGTYEVSSTSQLALLPWLLRVAHPCVRPAALSHLFLSSLPQEMDLDGALEFSDEAVLPAALRTFTPLGHEPKVRDEVEGLRELERAVELDPEDTDTIEALRNKLAGVKSAVDNAIGARIAGADLESTTSRVIESGMKSLEHVYKVAWGTIEACEGGKLQQCREAMKRMLTETQGRDSCQTTKDPTILYAQAARVKRQYRVVMRSIQKECGGLLLVSGLKETARIVEKIMLRPDSPGSADLIRDVNRSMHVCKTVDEIIACIHAFRACEDISIVRCQVEGAAKPEKKWTGFAINFYLSDDSNRHICEAIITHERIIAARRDIKGNEIDLIVRSAREILQLHTSLIVADVETSALKKFFENTCGHSWNKFKNWTTEAALDEWYGLSTDDTGQVSALNLQNNALDGDLAGLGALAQCTKLIHLDLSTNTSLRGNVRSLIKLTSLTVLSLKKCNLVTGTCDPLKELTSLQHLDISYTALEGVVEVFADLIRLKSLDVRGTRIDCSNAVDLLMMWASSLPTLQSDALIRAVQGKYEVETSGQTLVRASQKIDEALARLDRLSGREHNTDEEFAPDGSQWVIGKGSGLVEAQVEEKSQFTLLFPVDEHGDVVPIDDSKIMVAMASLLTEEEKEKLRSMFIDAVRSSKHHERSHGGDHELEEDDEVYAAGTLDKDYFVDVVNKLTQESGGRPQSLDRLERVFREADADESETIDLEEFLDLYAKVKKGDGPKGLAGPRSSRAVDEEDAAVGFTDSTGNITEVSVENQGDGSVVVSYIPGIDGMVELRVEIAGVPVRGSPFQFYVLPPPMRFKWTSFEDIELSNNNRIARNVAETDYRYAIAWPSLPSDKSLLWRLRISKLGGGCFLGIIGGNHHPHNTAYDTHDAFVWQNTGTVWIGGEATRGHQDWAGFQEGDEPLFRYDPAHGMLHMQLSRGGSVIGSYSIATGPCPPEGFRVLANLRCFDECCVELVLAADAEWQEVAESAN